MYVTRSGWSLRAFAVTASSDPVGRQTGMYGPPPCCKRKNESDGLVCANVFGLCWESRLLARMECAALRSPLVGQSRGTTSGCGFGERRDRPLCHLMVRQQTWQSSELRSRRRFADVGIAQRFPSLSLDRRHPQTGHVGHDGRPIGASAGQHGPRHACQLVGQGHTDDVVVAAR